MGKLLHHKAILSIFYGRRIPTEVFVPCRRKKKLKKKKPSGVFLVRDFLKSWFFLGRKTTDLEEKNFSQHVGGKNKIKLKCQFFFLVGDNFISSEDSSPVEYTESGLKADWKILRKTLNAIILTPTDGISI